MASLKELLKKAYDTEEKTLSSINFNLTFERLTDEQVIHKIRLLAHKLSAYKKIPPELRKKLVLEFFRLAFIKGPRKSGAFHPSEISTEVEVCKRKMYFQYSETAPDPMFVRDADVDNKLQRIFDTGTMVHLYMQSSLDKGGVLEDFEVEVSSPEYGIEGEADGIVHLYNKRLGLEIKTINSFGYSALRAPKLEHIKQASIYFYFLGIKEVLYVYFNKDTSDFKEYIVPVDEEYVEWFKKLSKEITVRYFSNMRRTRSDDLTGHDIFPRTACTKRTEKRAMRCPFADTCFKLK